MQWIPFGVAAAAGIPFAFLQLYFLKRIASGVRAGIWIGAKLLLWAALIVVAALIHWSALAGLLSAAGIVLTVSLVRLYQAEKRESDPIRRGRSDAGD